MTKALKMGEIVYLKTDIDGLPRIVTGHIRRPSGKMYYLASCNSESVHFPFEITKDRPRGAIQGYKP